MLATGTPLSMARKQFQLLKYSETTTESRVSNHSIGIDNDIDSTVDAMSKCIEKCGKPLERLNKISTVTKTEEKQCYLSAPTYDQNLLRLLKMSEMSKGKGIDKLHCFNFTSFVQEIYKPTNNNLRTSSNTSRYNQDNSPRIKRGTGYDNQRRRKAGVHEANKLIGRIDTDDESKNRN
ncbi:hypothetical protein Tco_0759370 [Tanacetum coccineum]